MNRLKFGFTMIEVSLFLAITGLLFVGIAAGVNAGISQQRYTDSVQNFVEYLRSIYSETTNVQSEGNGTSNQAIYGKLVTFGQSKDLAGKDVNTDEYLVFSYNVIGNIDGIVDDNDPKKALAKANINVIISNEDKVRPVGIAESYNPKWGSKIQDDNKAKFKGAVLVVRHPTSGTVYTFTMSNKTIEVNQAIASNTQKDLLKDELNNFSTNAMDICLAPDGNESLRKDIRIVKNSRNASGIEIINDSAEDNKCR